MKRVNPVSVWAALCMLASGATAAHAQSTEIPAPRQRTPVVLRHAEVRSCVAGSAPIADGFVVFDKGVITAVGAEPMDAALGPADAQVIEAKGMIVTPGLWAGASTLGLIETEQVAATDDRTEFGDFHPEIKASSAANPDSDLPPVARNAGILMAHVFPSGGIVGGHASAMRLDGWTAVDRTVKPEAGMIVRWPVMEPVTAAWMDKKVQEQRKARDRSLRELEKLFDTAEAYLRARQADGALAVDARFEALRGVIEGKEPILLEANWPGQIEAGVLWCVRRKYKVVVVGGLGAPEVAALLKEHNVPVVITGVHRAPLRERDAVDAPFTVASRLAAAGVDFSIASGSPPAHERTLPAQCGTAVAHGLERTRALEAVTRVPAELAGVGDRYGTLQPGRSATLVLFSADPFEITSLVRRAWIDGGEVDLNDRQKRMRAKYLEKELQREEAAPAAAAPAGVPSTP